MASPATVLVVDDDEAVRRLLGRMLERASQRWIEASSLHEARRAIEDHHPNVVLCDVYLPDGTGEQLARELSGNGHDAATLLISGLDDSTLAELALRSGADGYILKPLAENEVVAAVGRAAEVRRHRIERESAGSDLEQLALELRASQEETIQRLSIAIELRDVETATHVTAMSALCRRIAAGLGLPDERCDLIHRASPMHDVGKVGIADRVLLKAGPLTTEERGEMERHAELGYRILAGSTSSLLQMAATIALTHHERYHGDGYPRGLSGDEIPLEGRIAAVADVFDALTRDRVYRRALPREAALQHLERGRGSDFDPEILDAFEAAVAA